MNIETERLRARIDALGKMLAELERMLAQGQRYQRLAKSNNQKDRPSLTLRHCASSGCAVSKRQSRPSQEQIKLAFESLDLLILRSLLDQAMTRKPRYDQPLMNLLTRARDLLAECNTTVVLQRRGKQRQTTA